MTAIFAALLAVTQPWLFVSDLHVDPFDRSPLPAPYQRDANWALFDSSLTRMRAAVPNARVVIIAGDFLAHHFGDKVHAAKVKESVSDAALRTLRRIARSFAGSFPRAQFIVTMGNNDDPCGDYQTAPSTAYMAAVAKIWAPLVNRNRASPGFIQDFTRSGSYSARMPGGARAIVVDDVYWSLVYRPCDGAPAAQPQLELRSLADRLRRLRPREHAIIIMHIPPGIDATATLLTQRFLVVPYWNASILTRFRAILHRYRDRIGFAAAGHAHRADFRLVEDVPILIAPSISPIYTNNPAFLTLRVGEDGRLSDYRMYADALPSGHWSALYDFDRLYGVAGFSTAALENVHQHILADPSLRVRWAQSLVAGSAEYDIGSVWRAYWCAQTELGAGYARCAGDVRRVTFLRAAVFAAAAALLAVAVLAFVRLGRQRHGA